MRNIRNGDYMLRKLENEIVKECAPTLAGIKMANLFNYRFVSALCTILCDMLEKSCPKSVLIFS